ncbi:L,D-transpeptidase family protein [Ferruginibacter sp. SUN002]|uniref:L,D-transpeptidase family protein n=1 Tax=Ferruginibacter sp. SUN002 TaxID=2937789 RepID=UPI003D35F0C9
MKNTWFAKPILFLICISLLAFVPPKKKKKRTVKKAVTTKLVSKPQPKPAPAVEDSVENPYYIIVDKSDYELKVYDDEGWYATYPVVFGGKDLGDKMKEGDKKTPEGNYKVILKKIHNKWGPELLLDYPNPTNIQKFNERKAKGVIPKNARIGSGIAIHATRPEEEWTVDNYYNWTDGCVSVKYTEMKDLYSYIPVGTPVTIQP